MSDTRNQLEELKKYNTIADRFVYTATGEYANRGCSVPDAPTDEAHDDVDYNVSGYTSKTSYDKINDPSDDVLQGIEGFSSIKGTQPSDTPASYCSVGKQLFARVNKN